MEKQTISVQELSSMLGISLPKAYELVKKPGFPVIRIGSRILIPINAFKEWLAVFTGDVVLDEPLKESTAAVLLTLERNMRKAEKVKYSEKRDGDREIFDIVCNLRKQKNGDKFKKLYDDGDITGYGSQSEADAALCALIAFRTGPDPAAIDEIFRSSAL